MSWPSRGRRARPGPHSGSFRLVVGVGGRGKAWEQIGGNFWVCRIAIRTGIKSQSSASWLGGRALNCRWSEKGHLWERMERCADIRGDRGMDDVFLRPSTHSWFLDGEHTVAGVARVLGHNNDLIPNVYFFFVRPVLATLTFLHTPPSYIHHPFSLLYFSP